MRGQLDLDLLDLHACARTVPVDLDVVYIDHLVATRTTLCSYASFWGAIFLKKKNFPPRTAHMDRKSSLRGVQNRAICKNLRSGSKDIWVLVSSMLDSASFRQHCFNTVKLVFLNQGKSAGHLRELKTETPPKLDEETDFFHRSKFSPHLLIKSCRNPCHLENFDESPENWRFFNSQFLNQRITLDLHVATGTCGSTCSVYRLVLLVLHVLQIYRGASQLDLPQYQQEFLDSTGNNTCICCC